MFVCSQLYCLQAFKRIAFKISQPDTNGSFFFVPKSQTLLYVILQLFAQLPAQYKRLTIQFVQHIATLTNVWVMKIFGLLPRLGYLQAVFDCANPPKKNKKRYRNNASIAELPVRVLHCACTHSRRYLCFSFVLPVVSLCVLSLFSVSSLPP